MEWAGSLYFQMFGLTMQRLPRPVLMHSILRPASFSYARSTLQCWSSMGITNQARRICQTEHLPLPVAAQLSLRFRPPEQSQNVTRWNGCCTHGLGWLTRHSVAFSRRSTSLSHHPLYPGKEKYAQVAKQVGFLIIAST